MTVHFLVRETTREEGVYKKKYIHGSIQDTNTIDITRVTCSYCIDSMSPEEDMKYRLSKVPYSELETLVRRLASDCNVLDIIIELHNLAKDIDKRLPTRWRHELEKREDR